MRSSPPLKKRILVAEDDVTVSRLLVELLEKSGMNAQSVDNGNRVMPLILTGKFDLLLLDLLLPGKSGMDVLRELRKNSDIPVVILSALSSEKDRIEGLLLGSNDYIIKPYYPREVLIRIQKILQERPSREKIDSNVIKIGILTAYILQKKIMIRDVDLRLTVLEFDALMILIRNIGNVVDRNTISQDIYEDDLSTSTRKIDMKINHIRKKLGDHSDMIRSVWGVGYEFIPKSES